MVVKLTWYPVNVCCTAAASVSRDVVVAHVPVPIDSLKFSRC